MTPKEKAQDLYQMYYECLWHQDEQSRIQNAKQGSLIAVDEQISLLLNLTTYMAFPNQVIYLQEVKQEIEKL